jgi:hypothetical protein
MKKDSPVNLSASVHQRLKDMAREIREYFIPDFSNWKDHDAYKKAFDRLARDLKAEPANE